MNGINNKDMMNAATLTVEIRIEMWGTITNKLSDMNKPVTSNTLTNFLANVVLRDVDLSKNQLDAFRADAGMFLKACDILKAEDTRLSTRSIMPIMKNMGAKDWSAFEEWSNEIKEEPKKEEEKEEEKDELKEQLISIVQDLAIIHSAGEVLMKHDDKVVRLMAMTICEMAKKVLKDLSGEEVE